MGSRLALRLTGGRREFYVASPETVTPTFGSEVFVNPGFESGDPPSSWTVYNTPTTRERSDVEQHGGSYSIHMVCDSKYDGVYQRPALDIGSFYRCEVWNKRVSGDFQFTASVELGYPSQSTKTGTDWAQLMWDALAVDTEPYMFVRSSNDGAAEFYADDALMKPFIMSSLLGDVADCGREGYFVSAWATKPTKYKIVGMVICLDDEFTPQNYVGVWFWNEKVYLAKWVGGILTVVQSGTSVTWSNGAELEIKKFGTSFTVSYNGVVVGTVRTISDAGVIGNVKCGWFTTDGALKPSYWKHY